MQDLENDGPKWPNFVFGAENENFWWFRSLSFSAENDFAFSFSVSFSVETQNENTEIHQADIMC